MSSVAVIVAAYQAEATIERALASVVDEPEASEVIVVDDGSGDGTVARARAFAERSPKVKVIQFDRNRGPSAARNRAIAESAAPWLTVLDADDFLQPGRLARLIALADGYDFVADDLFQVDEGFESAPPRTVWQAGAWAPLDLDLAAFVAANVPDPSRPRRELGFLKPLMRRAALDRLALRYDESIRLGEDYDLYARALAARARFRFAPAQGYVSVVRANSLSGAHAIADLERLRDVDTALLQRTDLTQAEIHALRRHRISTDKRLQWRIVIDAVKTRDPVRFGAAFLRGPEVAAHLAGQLAADFDRRILRRNVAAS